LFTVQNNFHEFKFCFYGKLIKIIFIFQGI
jgi:hypothetical protein